MGWVSKRSKAITSHTLSFSSYTLLLLISVSEFNFWNTINNIPEFVFSEINTPFCKKYFLEYFDGVKGEI